MTFDPTKPVQTRDGQKARIICTDARFSTGANILALQMDKYGYEWFQSYFHCGQVSQEAECGGDLINIPEEHEGWINIHKAENGPGFWCQTVYTSKEMATEANTVWEVIACIPIKFKEGDGL